MKKRVLFTALSALAVSIMFSGCKNDETVFPIETIDTTHIDTTPIVEIPEETLTVVDTTQFVERDLEAEFQAMVDERLQSVYFEYNSYELSPESETILAAAAEFLTMNDRARTLRIKVTGHTDERGSTDYNLALGERRAAAVRSYLLSYGVNGSRIEITSAGKEMPSMRGCTTDDCHYRNRRAEFMVIN